MSTKVALVIPPPNVKGFDITSAAYPHIGIAYLAAYLREQGMAIKIFDGNVVDDIRLITQAILNFSPEFVGFTATTCDIKTAHAIAARIKAAKPAIHNVVGGAFISGAREDGLSEFSAFDFGIVGEGEGVFYKLIQAIKQNTNYNLPGVIGRTNTKLLYTPRDGKYLAIDELPYPAWDLFDLKKYRGKKVFTNQKTNELFVQIARGCPFNCGFCFNVQGPVVRERNVKSIIQELTYLQNQYQMSSAIFASETFTLNKVFVKELCTAMIANGLNKTLEWACMTRADQLDDELLDVMKESGCTGISLGLESGDQNILNSVVKGTELTKLKTVIDKIAAKRIRILGSFILGLPKDTIHSILKTIRFACTLKLDCVTFGLCVPFPGTKIYEYYSQKNAILTKDWDIYKTHSMDYRLVKHPHLSNFTLALLQKYAYLRFYLRPRYFLYIFLMLDIKHLFKNILLHIKMFINKSS